MLVALSVVEQRLDAVRAVLAGASVTEVAVQVGVWNAAPGENRIGLFPASDIRRLPAPS